MNRSLVWLVETPFTKRDERRYGIHQLVRLNWQVTVIDCSQVLDMLKAVNYNYVLGNSTGYTLLRPLSTHELIGSLNEISPKFVINAGALNYSGKRAYAKKLLLKLYIKVRFTQVVLRLTSSHHVNHNNLGLFLYLIKTVFRYPLEAPWILLAPDITLTAGRAIAQNTFSKAIISSHSYDYDDYLKSYLSQKAGCPREGLQKILFLDQKGIFGTDVMTSSNSKNVTSGQLEYYEHVNYFLDKLSKKLDMFAEIQLHPKSLISKDYFKHGISNKSLSEAVSEARLIIGHSSASLQMAILFKKPIILLESRAMKNEAKVRRDMQRLSYLLGIKIIKWSKPDEVLSVPSINIGLYSDYIDNYIIDSDGFPELYTWEILDKALHMYVSGMGQSAIGAFADDD